MNDDYIKQYNEWREDVKSKLDQMMIDCVLEIYEKPFIAGKMWLYEENNNLMPKHYRIMYNEMFDSEKPSEQYPINHFILDIYDYNQEKRNWRKFCRVRNECEKIAKELGVYWKTLYQHL